MGVLLLTDGGFQGDGLLGDLQNLPDLLHGHVHLSCNLVGRGIVAQFLQQLAADPDDLVDGLHHVDGDADGTGLVCDGAGDGLPNPPGGIGRELVALGVIELLHGFDEAQVALLNQVQEQHAPAHVPLGDGDHQTEVGFRQFLLGGLTLLVILLPGGFLFRCDIHRFTGLTAALQFLQLPGSLIAGGHGLGQINLLVRGEQGDLANLLQIHADGVVNGEVVDQGVGVHQLLFLHVGNLFGSGLIVRQLRQQIVVGADINVQRL